MGIKLSEQGFNQIRCKVQNPQNGKEYVTIYEPSEAELDDLMNEIIKKDYITVKDDEIVGEITGAKFIFDLLERFTDVVVDLDWENKEDRKIIKRMIKNPNPILKLVLLELGNISNYVLTLVVKRVELMSTMSEQQKELVEKEIELNKLNEEMEKLAGEVEDIE